jgi:phosphopantothenoylcysteine decarboxylase / phosphopantothenate---cysteine ligase
MMLKNKKILLGVTGGIAAYKAIDLASHLTKAGAIVKTIMSDHAREFVTPINFAAITHQPVYWNQWDVAEPIAHITCADWADIVVIAPATANVVAKAAHGIADDLLTSTLLAVTCPILFVPSMNIHMYANQITQSNMKNLIERGIFCLEPDKGSLACGYEGKGRFPDTKEIIYALETYLEHGRDLIKKKIMITAGGSVEKIDPMRAITNMSSGKMGLALARAAWLRGAEVTFIHGSITEKIPYYLEPISAITAAEMYKAVHAKAASQDIIIMAAAVADYTVYKPEIHKIKKTSDLNLSLKKTKDILEELGKKRTAHQKLIGFAAETQDLEKYAKEKLAKKNLDMIVANYLEVSGKEDTEVLILSAKSKKKYSGSKFQVAHSILDSIIHE